MQQLLYAVSSLSKTGVGLLTDKPSFVAHPGQNGAAIPLRIMPLGGSVTFGVGSSDGNGYRNELFNLLIAAGYQVTMLGSRASGSMTGNNNEGWRGFRIDQIETKVMRSVAKTLPNLFTVNAGSNDCIQNLDLENAAERMGSMSEKLWLASPGSTIILSTLLPNYDARVDSRVQFVNQQFKELAKSKSAKGKRMVLVDMYCDSGPQTQDFVDGTHPNDSGYKQMARIWFDGIQEANRFGFLQSSQDN
ncbi:unnamed protein product [Clonostachys rosea]|uniref:SGNH hydrolase-type esterase domain-containing protein n=1 Tax=Bionectria ochroleuca TaxID=29856 RepID=A0ABY6U5K7_BIOOC|nr:unnamed protein product [Clonostachys rosea]